MLVNSVAGPMYRIYSRFDVGDFCTWHECKGCQPKFSLGEHEAARDWLRGFLVDDAHAVTLRRLAHLAGGDVGLTQHSTQGVIEQLAGLIACGQLRVCGKDQAVHLIQTSTGTAPPGPPPPPPAARGASAPVVAPPPAPSTLPAQVDAAAMAKTLVAAAAEGAPFCEICEKKKQQQAAQQAAEATA